MLYRARILYRYLRQKEIKNGIKSALKLDKGFTKQCLICGDKVDTFYPFGVNDEFFTRHNIIGGGYRQNCLCLHCKSIDRERWQYYTIKTHTDLLTSSCSVLHIAPEKWLSDNIKSNKKCDYYGGDIRPGIADHIVDLTNMTDLGEDRFDYAIVNHVMEHITEEKQAFEEIKRVLKPSGKLILSFPICTDSETYEDGSVNTDEKRLYYYGQKDHVRLYGIDYLNRIMGFGFRVEVFSPNKELSREDIEKYGLIENDIVMICSKA